MKTYISLVTAMVAATLFSGCAATHNIGDQRAEKKPGQGTVVVYRESAFAGSLRDANVESNRGHVCAVPNGSAVVMNADPGPLTLSVDFPDGFGLSELTINVLKDNTSFVLAEKNNTDLYGAMAGGLIGAMVAKSVVDSDNKASAGSFHLMQTTERSAVEKHGPPKGQTLCGLR